MPVNSYIKNDSSMEDLITIALPVYKRVDFIRKALDSALNQTVKCRVLLIDNNSPHNDFKDIVESYNNPLLSYVRTLQTVPQDENFNNCFRYAQTPWVTILHDDDMLHCQFVEMAQKVLLRFNFNIGGLTVKSVVDTVEWKDINNPVALTDNFDKVNKPFFFFAQLTPFVGVVLNREKALEIGGFNANLHPIADFDFWYRYSTNAKMIMVNQALAYYRISPVQSTNHLVGDMINNVYQYRLNLIKQSGYNNPLSYLALEESRINNINFFKRTYPDISIPSDLPNIKRLKRAEKLLQVGLISKTVQFYRRKISLTKALV
jgi:glycosyltransferase